jgi:hypothetical protein
MIIVLSSEQRIEILSNIAENTGKRINVVLQPYSANAMKDSSADIQWMYRFSAFENRIFRVQNGTTTFRNVDISMNCPINVDDVTDTILRAIRELERTQF